MKATLLKLTALLLILAGVAATCNKPPLDYPVNIPFTEYSLNGIQCQWANLAYDGKVIIINSNEELEKYITCASKNYPEIDFSKHSLLLANGTKNSGIVKVNINNLQQIDSNNYKLNIKITSFESTVAETWVKALIVKKMNIENNTKLNITEEQWSLGLELGYYKEKIGGTYKVQFYDRENLGLHSQYLTVVYDFKYEIFRDSIKIKADVPNAKFNTYYFHIINNTKFETNFPDLTSTDSVYYIFEK